MNLLVFDLSADGTERRIWCLASHAHPRHNNIDDGRYGWGV
jgi:hypothetical protein